MTTVLPQSEALRRAVKWISLHLQNDPQSDLLKLTQEAILRFDLSPKEELFLINFYKNLNNE
jgi:hypothetical protein